ncbi:MAG: Lrp/AsnC family transcriptional regulator [Candidatus Thorarchaeota archaeon]|nr:Lrp/AsnC family transcriptional regulator [Candidatus Thorarchaeota archaeon]
MDTIDRGIIWELHQNCRMSYQTIADKFELTANAVRGRIQRMIEIGVIDSFVVMPSLEMIDSDVMFALTYTDGMEDTEEFISRLGQNPMVVLVGLGACVDGNVYTVLVQYIRSEGLNRITSFLRNNKEVTKVDAYPILYKRGGKIQLTKADLRVLKVLTEDARLPISEIAKQVGFTSRRVRKILDHFLETDSIWTAVRWNLNVSDYIQFLMKTTYDERLIKADELVKWLKDSYPLKYWDTHFSAASPDVFVEFVVDNLRDVEQLQRSMKRAHFIKSASPLLRYSELKFQWLGERYLRNMISEIESKK